MSGTMEKNWWSVAALVVLIALVAVVLKQKPSAPAALPASAAPLYDLGTYAYKCNDGTEFTMSPSHNMESVKITPATIDGSQPTPVVLQNTATSTGALFTAGSLSFYGLGETAHVSDGTSSIVCTPVPVPNEAPFNFGE